MGSNLEVYSVQRLSITTKICYNTLEALQLCIALISDSSISCFGSPLTSMLGTPSSSSMAAILFLYLSFTSLALKILPNNMKLILDKDPTTASFIFTFSWYRDQWRPQPQYPYVYFGKESWGSTPYVNIPSWLCYTNIGNPSSLSCLNNLFSQKWNVHKCTAITCEICGWSGLNMILNTQTLLSCS